MILGDLDRRSEIDPALQKDSPASRNYEQLIIVCLEHAQDIKLFYVEAG